MIALLTLALGAVFTVAAVGKCFAFAGFRRVLRYTLRLDQDQARVLGLCVITGEAVAATTGFAAVDAGGPVLYFDLVVAGVLISAFTGWIAMVLRRRLVISCPCFGGAAANVSWRALLRNLATLAMIVTTIVIAGRDETSGTRQLILAAVVLAVSCGFAAYRFVRPHLLTLGRVRALVDGVEGSS